MEVGFNYPWPGNRYITIGPNLTPRGVPHPWRDDGVMARNLATLKAAGITVVRMWLLGDGTNYDGYVHYGFANDRGLFWDFEPPAQAHPSFVDDFRALLRIFAGAQMKIMPVLVDFAFFDHPRPERFVSGPTDGDYRRGRRAVAENPAYRKRFVEGMLEPLLKVAAEFTETVYAVDVCNEPHWATAWATGGVDYVSRMGLDPMVAFLTDCVGAVRRYGLPSTIGHRYYADLSGTYKDPAVDKPQYHYYAHLVVDDLPAGRQSRFAGAILGEFGSVTQSELDAMARSGKDVSRLKPTVSRWLGEFGGVDSDPDKILPLRLKHMASLGCQLAMIWPDLPDEVPDTLKLSTRKLDSIRGQRF